MAITVEVDAMFSTELAESATYTTAAGGTTTIRAIVAPQPRDIIQDDMAIQANFEANIYVPVEDVTSITLTLERDTITPTDNVVYTILTREIVAGGVYRYRCVKETISELVGRPTMRGF